MIANEHGRPPRRKQGGGLMALAATLLAGGAMAQTAGQTEALATAPPASSTPVSVAAQTPPPSQSMVVNLIRLLVKQGIITQDAADALMQQAEDEANQARAAAGAPSLSAVTPPPEGIIRVPYIPQVVRNQIKEDIKQDVLAQAQAEGWASPGSFPDWVSRIQFFGDFRFRDEFDLYSANNYGYDPKNPSISPGYIDYATLNANGPIDIDSVTNPSGPPILNTRVNRVNQLSLRAHFGLTAKVFDGVTTTIRLATGSDNSPVSTTQILGGGLTKKDIWLDQAYLTLTPTYWASISLGRTPDPFMHTSLLFDDNLNFDGVNATVTRQIGDQGLKMFAVGGLFPLGYVSTNFPTNAGAKAPDSSKWLYALQFGAEFQPDPLAWSARGAVAYYGFENVAGQISAPCAISQGVTQCSTDSSRPAFMQKGNTVFFLRDILPPPNANQFYAEPQFVGLAYDYRLVNVTADLEIPLFGPTRGQLEGDYVRNLAYDPAKIQANPFTQPVTNFDTNGNYRSGPTGWLVKFTVGYLRPGARGDWNFSGGYKYIEPDAVLDAFTDHDFHLGGTNAKGYFLSGNYYFANNAWISGRWLSATEVYGVPLAIDVLQLELNTKF